jgi:hypothetical protein
MTKKTTEKMADLTLKTLHEELAPLKTELVDIMQAIRVLQLNTQTELADIMRAIRVLQQDTRELRTFVVGLTHEMAKVSDRVAQLEDR